jgi:hypothetical protein
MDYSQVNSDDWGNLGKIVSALDFVVSGRARDVVGALAAIELAQVAQADAHPLPRLLPIRGEIEPSDEHPDYAA